MIPAIAWDGDASGALALLDQTLLPAEIVIRRLTTAADVADAIRRLVVRGAPAIGIAAAYGAVLAARDGALAAGIANLRASRPTAVNPFRALARIERVAAERGADPERLLAEARAIHDEDARLCDALGRHGSGLLADGARVLTHCNTGRLATGGIGTALGAIVTAVRDGKRLSVLVGETRPLLQGARLTAFELAEAGIPCTVLPDSAGSGLIARREVDAVIVGADRIALNADTANKLGTLALALAADRFGVPFHVVAPTTTIDPELETGAQIEIEERDPAEVLDRLRPRDVPAAAKARSPAFDVTPGELLTTLVTEHGVLERPRRETVKPLVAGGR